MDPQDFELACKAVTALERIADALEALENVDYSVDHSSVYLDRIADALEEINSELTLQRKIMADKND